ncbi:MAG TPA: isoprenylcysteine carboxylmethyltransferase family protein [Longimicrobiales bacterium]
MTNAAPLVLSLCAFAVLGVLPAAFFRPGRPTAGWCLTAAPFFADAAIVIAALAGVVSPVQLHARAASALAIAAVPLLALAILITGCTVGVHRAPVSLWHQEDDTPAQLITCGPYSRIRHPFYTAFILMLVGTAAALPHAATLGLLALGTLQLSRTARREERRLLASTLGHEYARYTARTGRFLPRLWPAGGAAVAIGSAGSRAESSSRAATRPAGQP